MRVVSYRFPLRRGFKRVTPVHGPELSLGRLPWSKVGSLEKFDEAVSKVSVST